MCTICVEPLRADGSCRYAATHPKDPIPRGVSRVRGIRGVKPQSLVGRMLTSEEAKAGVRRALPDYDGVKTGRQWPGRRVQRGYKP